MAEPVASEPSRAIRSLDLLAEAAAALHAERDAGRLVAWALEAATAIAGADAATLGLHTDDGPMWSTRGPSVVTLGPGADARSNRFLGPVVRGEAVRRSQGEEERPSAIASWSSSWMALPVCRQEGGAWGALVLGHREVDAFDAEAETAVAALAAHLGVALDNHATMKQLEQLRATQTEIVHQLQDAVRPPQITVPHTELDVHYQPAEASAPTGGDLYDWALLPDGSLHVAVVDVMGKGVAATKDALAVTHALRLLVLDGCPLADLVARADAIVCAQSPDLVATLIVAHYEPDTGRLRLAGAGHPPPMLVRGTDRTVQEVAAPGIPIGYPGAGTLEVVDLQLERSDSVIIYTDGLIESTKDILAGLASLAAAASATAGYKARHLARALVERALDGASWQDDSLALVLRRRVPPEAGGRQPLSPFEYRFSPNTATVPLGRHFLHDWLVQLPVDPDEAYELVLAAAELCGNAIRHGTGAPASVVLRAWAEGDDVILEVEDDGDPFVLPVGHPDDGVPDVAAETGRGLFLVDAFTDDLEVGGEPGRTVVRAVKRAVINTAPIADQAVAASRSPSTSEAKPAMSVTS